MPYRRGKESSAFKSSWFTFMFVSRELSMLLTQGGEFSEVEETGAVL